MSKPTSFTEARRKFLKSTVAVSALSITGLSGLAAAARSKPAVDALSGAAVPGGGIKVIQETLFDREQVTLINQSGKLQMLDARQPVSLYQSGGGLVVRVNQDDAAAMNGMVVMSPGDQWTFDVKAIGIEVHNNTNLPVLTGLAENELRISSAQHAVFNRIVPVQVI